MSKKKKRQNDITLDTEQRKATKFDASGVAKIPIKKSVNEAPIVVEGYEESPIF